jgi:branched-chain amino acid transport system ATP-binding protein
MLKVAGLTKRFGGFLAVNGLSFDIARGELVGLIGPNGSGKTTTLGLIAGAMRPSSGSILLDAKEIGGLPPYQLCRMGIGRTFQVPRPIRRLSVLENVAIAAYFGRPGPTSEAQSREHARAALELVGLRVADETMTHGLGAAALKKLELARALASRPRLLLADESLGGLDSAEMEHATATLERIRRESDVTIVWVEHIMDVLMRLVDRVLVLDHGEIIFQGSPEGAARDPRVVEVYLGRRATQPPS